MQARTKGVANKNFLLLDNQSMMNQIANSSLLKNIQKLSKPFTIYCNAGVTKIDLEGELGGMTVYHKANSIVLHIAKEMDMSSYSPSTSPEQCGSFTKNSA